MKIDSEQDITEEEKREYLAYRSYLDVIDNYKSGIDTLREMKLDDYLGCSLLCGAIMAFDKGLSNFINELYKYNTSLFFLSEVTAEKRRYTDKVCNVPHICTPHLLAKEMIILGMDIPVSQDAIKMVSRKEYLLYAEKNVEMRHPNLGNGYAKMWVYYAYKYIDLLIKKVRPQEVILWNEFYAFHHIIQGYCKEHCIRLRYIEFGCLPGTICIEDFGQQGESMVSRKWFSYRHKYISTKEMKDAINTIQFMQMSGINRNYQPQCDLDINSLRCYDSRRKTIVYFGQNDFESGLQPYNNNSKKNHSPCFKTTLEALEYLETLCIKNGWNLIFKPHPTMVSLGHNGKSEMNEVGYVDNVNIDSVVDIADVVVTILSQVAYISLIREKPVVLLGYMQLKKKGCAYEAYKIHEIEKKIKRALKKGYTTKQKYYFKRHVSQLLKYYLFDDMTIRAVRYGICIENYAKYHMNTKTMYNKLRNMFQLQHWR